MPDDSCRKCGSMLAEYTVCAECREIVQQICSKCSYKPNEQFHFNCFFKRESIQGNTVILTS